MSDAFRLHDLSTLHPMLKSVSTVPVGLSDHREGLTELRESVMGFVEDNQ